jgi:hypothetical protein
LGSHKTQALTRFLVGAFFVVLKCVTSGVTFFLLARRKRIEKNSSLSVNILCASSSKKIAVLFLIAEP